MRELDGINELFIETFNIDLAELGSPARVAMPAGRGRRGLVDLLGADGVVLCSIPADTMPQMAAIAHDLHRASLEQGMAAGEQAAWSKLRALIGAASG